MRRSIWDEFRRMQREFDRLFSSLLDYDYYDEYALPDYSNREVVSREYYKDYSRPLADIWEDEKEFIATVELPGVDKKDIQLNITDDNKLEIKVEKKDEVKQEDKKKGIYRLERSYSGFYRVIPLPDYVEVDKIDANYKNGVLEIRIPKKADSSSNKKRIDIK